MSGHQPNYLPWLGLFDKISRCDLFIIEDNVQFERQGFTNRNKIKTSNGVKWLTVPVEHAGQPLLINDVRIANKNAPNWAQKHWLTLKYNYCRAPFWREYQDFFEQTYSQKWTMLIDLNMHIIRGLMRFFKIDKPLVTASSLRVSGRKSELVLNQCKAVGATVLLAGIGARAYLNIKRFEEEGIKVIFQDFKHPVYPQLHGNFVPNLSAIDYLFCVGGENFDEQRSNY
ncbi:MAG: WbqC family protein [Candidatus Bathyarchaeia archaeon]